MSMIRFSRLLLVSLVMVGCGKPAATTPKPAASKPADPRFLLAADPANPLSVIEAKKSAKNDEAITLVGRIGGDVKPWIEGRASFLLVDSSFKPCNEIPGDSCETPWDYCCESDLAKGKATIKFVNDKGETLPTDARDLLAVKELQTLVVKGKAKRDDAGNLVVLAEGIFVRK